MLIGITLAILVMLVIFSLIFGSNPIGIAQKINIDNSVLFTEEFQTFFTDAQNVIFSIDTSSLIVSGIALLVSVIVVASIVGIQVFASGLSESTVRVIILLTGFIGIWTALSLLVFNLIKSIEVFGSIIYIILTLGYTIGVIQKISEG